MRRIRKERFDPAHTILQIRDTESILRKAKSGGILSLVAKSSINFYTAQFETRHVIVEKDFTKISDNKKKAEI